MQELLQKWALLMTLVELGQQHRQQVGHTFMQKAVYLLQAGFGVRAGYEFKLYHYGPYSEGLWSDLRLLSDIEVLQIDPDPNGYGFWIKLKEQTRSDLIRKSAKGVPVETARTLADFVGDKDVRELELLATTHFVCTDLKAKKRGASDTEVAGHVVRLKPHFTKDEVKGALNALRVQRMLG